MNRSLNTVLIVLLFVLGVFISSCSRKESFDPEGEYRMTGVTRELSDVSVPLSQLTLPDSVNAPIRIELDDKEITLTSARGKETGKWKFASDQLDFSKEIWLMASFNNKPYDTMAKLDSIGGGRLYKTWKTKNGKVILSYSKVFRAEYK